MKVGHIYSFTLSVRVTDCQTVVDKVTIKQFYSVLLIINNLKKLNENEVPFSCMVVLIQLPDI